MLYPFPGSYGFLEWTWEVFETSPLGPERKLANIRLSSISVALDFSDTNSSLPNPLFAGLQPLRPSLPTVPGTWNIPGTSMTLYFASRELDLPPKYVIWPLNTLIGHSWISFASTQRVGRVGEIVSTDDSDTVQVTMEPRMEPPIPYQPLTTDTDLVEAAVGIVCFMSTQRFFATKIIMLRPDERGIRIPVGDIEILNKRSPLRQVSSGNTSSIENA
ncbi:MAG: hypothetical protein Q9195_006450 [Heterodermia aff. obscurata]